jgi:O-antigen ligase
VFHLPLAAQRALSFLPGDWDNRATIEAEGSTEWRIEMWKLALTSDRYIHNKWLGDGFGFTMAELQYQQELKMKGAHPSQVQDYYLVVGTYHSGPIETIKRIGYIGLCVLLIAFGVFMWEAKSLVNKSRGTPYFPYALYVVLPIMIIPIKFVFIFGAFQPTVSLFLLSGAMLRIIETSLENWEGNRHIEESGEESFHSKGIVVGNAR